MNISPVNSAPTADAASPPWRGRAALLAPVAIVLLLSWWWIVAMARDMYGAMTGASAWMMTSVWDATHLLLLWTMWAVMMAAMMLPSAWPMLMMYATLSRKQPAGQHNASHLYLFAAAYVLVWALFSVAATVAQRVLANLLLVSPMMEMTSPAASAALLFVAGVYQITPLKRMCLMTCRSPISFLIAKWRPGSAGAFRMGMEHGVYCVGCCWALMLLLFVGGVMNLYVIAALTVLVAIEKVIWTGDWGNWLSGGLLIALAVWLLAR